MSVYIYIHIHTYVYNTRFRSNAPCMRVWLVCVCGKTQRCFSGAQKYHFGGKYLLLCKGYFLRIQKCCSEAQKCDFGDTKVLFCKSIVLILMYKGVHSCTKVLFLRYKGVVLMYTSTIFDMEMYCFAKALF